MFESPKIESAFFECGNFQFFKFLKVELKVLSSRFGTFKCSTIVSTLTVSYSSFCFSGLLISTMPVPLSLCTASTLSSPLSLNRFNVHLIAFLCISWVNWMHGLYVILISISHGETDWKVCFDRLFAAHDVRPKMLFFPKHCNFLLSFRCFSF